MNQLGYFGKTPHQGDFVRFNLPQTFIKVWDDWLQQFMISGESLGDAWPGLYASAPSYQFVLSGGIAGSTPWVGALRPSKDKVGRRFPFCIAMSLPEDALPCVSAIRTKALFDDLDALLDRVMDSEYSFDNLQSELALIAETHAQVVEDEDSPKSIENKLVGEAVTIGMDNAGAFHSAEALPAILDVVLQQTLGAYSLWFAYGAQEATVICSGLPVDAAGLALISTKWRTASTAYLNLDGLLIKPEFANTSAMLPPQSLTTNSLDTEITEQAISPSQSTSDNAQVEAVDQTLIAKARHLSPVKNSDLLTTTGSVEHAPSSDDWAAFDHFAETPEIIGSVVMPEVEPLELEDDDNQDEPWDK